MRVLLSAAALAAALLCAVAVPPTAMGTGEELPSALMSVESTRDGCYKQLGMTPAEDLRGSDPHYKIMYCMMLKDGTIGADGKFSADAVLETVSKSADPERFASFKAMIEACRVELEAETAQKEELAKAVMECFRREGKEMMSASTTTSPA